MKYETFSVKLYELKERLDSLNRQIHLSETGSHSQLRQEITKLRKTCAENEQKLRDKLQMSRADMVSEIRNGYCGIEQILQKTGIDLQMQISRCENDDAAVEEKILLAEYALDFAVQAADRAMLFSMEAIDAQRTLQEQEGRTL